MEAAIQDLEDYDVENRLTAYENFADASKSFDEESSWFYNAKSTYNEKKCQKK